MSFSRILSSITENTVKRKSTSVYSTIAMCRPTQKPVTSNRNIYPKTHSLRMHENSLNENNKHQNELSVKRFVTNGSVTQFDFCDRLRKLINFPVFVLRFSCVGLNAFVNHALNFFFSCLLLAF